MALMLFMFLNLTVAQTGNIQGVVKDSKTQEILIGSTIIIQGTSVGITSDINGSFILSNIKPGKHILQISYISYKTKQQIVDIESNKTTHIEILLEEITNELSGVTVTAIKKNNTEISTINNIKSAPVVVSGISSQLISKTQDKDASEVVKRLPGVSVVDDKFIIIRGLSSRYNNVWINNSTAPSSEIDTRSFSFDIIPSSIVDNILIYKSPMAELPSDYSGGFIKISTIGIPSQNSTSVSYETSFNQYTSFNDFLKEKDNVWEPTKITGIPGQKLSFGLNRKWEKGKSVFGSVTSLSYSYSNKHYKDVINNNYSIYDFKNDKPSFNDEFVDNYYKNTNKVSFLQNFTYYPANDLKLEFKNFINNIWQSSTANRYGREWYNDGRYNKSTELTHNNRFMYTGQLGAEKKFENSSIDLTLGYSSSIKSDPDIRRYRYISDNDQTYIIMFGTNPDLSSLSQMNLDLHENILSSSLNYTKTFTNIELKTGVFFENKIRTFDARNFGYSSVNSYSYQTTLSVPEIMTSGEVVKEEVTAPSDSYDAAGKILAIYVNGKFTLNKVNISGGLRVEKDIQTLDSYRQGTTIPVNVKRDTINFFPSANISYNINKKNIIRATYGLSINRPEFREIAPFYFVDFDLNAGIYGNENIKAAYVHNLDLRYELYPKNDETFNIGVFYKRFINPIEVIILGNNPTQYSFDNVPVAYSYGIETEARKSLDFIGLKDFSTVANLSLIKSSISFDRPLQGQSPYIINLGLYYTTEKTSANISYNVIGKRIIAVGRWSPNEWETIPDIYEMPRNEVDFNISRKISKHFEIKTGVKDVLNKNIQYQQNIDTKVDMSLYGSEGTKHFDRNQITKMYHPGRQFLITLSYKF